MFEEIKKKIKGKKLILFGEIHGTKEIPKIITKFFSEIKEDFDLCLEIPEEFQNELDSFMQGGKTPSFFEIDLLDGRNSKEYFELIEEIKKINEDKIKKINIFCVDSFAKSQKEKEENLAKNILKVLNEKTVFAIMGEIHSSKEKINFNDLEIITAGNILHGKLKEEIFSVRIKPKEGKYFNFGEKEIVNFSGFFDEGFDYVLEVKKVSPCTFKNKD